MKNFNDDEREKMKNFNDDVSEWWTDAPEAYDYCYVTTMGERRDTNDKVWRKISVIDSYRFREYQFPRYRSGLYQSFPVGSESAERAGLQ